VLLAPDLEPELGDADVLLLGVGGRLHREGVVPLDGCDRGLDPVGGVRVEVVDAVELVAGVRRDGGLAVVAEELVFLLAVLEQFRPPGRLVEVGAHV
jgi:hypothetical protein